jgi:hypothetical protein
MLSPGINLKNIVVSEDQEPHEQLLPRLRSRRGNPNDFVPFAFGKLWKVR